MEKNNAFCVIPWVQLASKPIGTARVCCLMSNSKDIQQGIIKDENGIPYEFGKDDFDSIKNGKKSREIRLEMLNGHRPSDCMTCWTKEDMGATSKRIVSNRMYEKEFNIETARAHTDENGFTDWEPSYWDLRFGNLCNLKCVMCHPASSSQWYEDYVLLNREEYFRDGGKTINLKNINGRYKDQGEYDWWNNDIFWNNLEKKIPYLKQVYLVGGEPMLIEPHYDFLQKVIDSGRAGEVTLEYDTNLTAIHKRAFDLWKHFKKIWLRVSLDDYGPQFNYVRFPAKWSQVSKNLESISNDIDNLQLDFSVTWQVLTAFTTPNLLNYLKDFPNSNISVRILSTPEYFDVAILPSKIKKDLIEIYKNFQQENKNIKVNHLIKYLETNLEGNDEKLKKFFETVEKLDTIRKTSWKSSFTDLNEKINDNSF
jgi:organic radical activating enzyme